MLSLADLHTCTGCLACVDTCANSALTAYYNDEGHLTYKVNESLCVKCGLCEAVCPVVSNFDYGTNTLKKSKLYAAWCRDDALRARSSSGGVFAALAKHILDNGGVVAGAAIQDNQVRHIVIHSSEEILKLQGSKYAQSITEGIYRDVRENLQCGKDVLFSGLGCQVAGLLSFLGKRKYRGELFTVDLICGGVPSHFLIDYYLRENPNVIKIISFRNKQKYELSVMDINGKVRVVPLSERPLPLCGFYSELTNRYSCYDCMFTGAHRRSDITIGDYWGDTEFQKEHKNGLSVAVVHSEKGDALFKMAELEYHEIEWEGFLIHNPRMIDGHKNKSKSLVRKNLAKAFREYPYERLLQLYANKASWYEPTLLIRKAFRFMMGLLRSKLYQWRLRSTINKLNEQ